MKRKIVIMFLFALFSANISMIFAQRSSCNWDVVWCDNQQFEYFSACVNAGANTNSSCSCGQIEDCQPPPEY